MKNCYFLSCTTNSYIIAAAEIMKNNFKIIQNTIDCGKIEKYAASYSKRNFGTGKGRDGTVFSCCMSEFNDSGYVFNENALHNMCKTVVAINDKYGAVAAEILSRLTDHAVKQGLNVIVCENPFMRCKPEHIIINELSLAFCTSSAINKINNPTRSINIKRFCDYEQLCKHRQLLNFNIRLIKELIGI